jgi:predicted RNA-binding protein YlqC (UPF0109 family)
MRGTRSELAAGGKHMLEMLIAAFTDHRESINVTMRELSISVAYTIRVHDEDQGKVIGKGGLHIRAIKHLMQKAGRSVGLAIRVTLQTDEERRSIGAPFRNNPDYDPKPAVELLKSVVASLTANPAVVTAEKADEAIYFQIGLASAEDFNEFHLQDETNMTTKTALEALWKAYGNKEGAVFYVDVVQLAPAGKRR